MSVQHMLLEGFTIRQILETGQMVTLIDWSNFLITAESMTDILEREAEIEELIQQGILNPLS